MILRGISLEDILDPPAKPVKTGDLCPLCGETRNHKHAKALLGYFEQNWRRRAEYVGDAPKAKPPGRPASEPPPGLVCSARLGAVEKLL